MKEYQKKDQATSGQNSIQQENATSPLNKKTFEAGFTPENTPQGDITTQLKGIKDQSPQNRITTQLKGMQSQTPQDQITTQLKDISGDTKQNAVQTENKTGMPNSLKTGVESLSGMDMSDVKVHYNSTKPAQLKAHAYAQGTDIHLAPGQEQHLPHEAWHVVQQKQGRVQATTQLKGTAINDNAGLEKEADVMGAKALQTKVSENNKSLSKGGTGSSDVQRKVVQRFGEDVIEDLTWVLMELSVTEISEQVKSKIIEVTTQYDDNDRTKIADVKKKVFDAVYDYRDGISNKQTGYENVEEIRQNFSNSPAFWEQLIHQAMGQKQKEKAADYSKFKKRYQQMGKGAKKASNRITLECGMGQGVMGSLHKYVLFSGSFSSCSPVIMYNHQTRIAGLFHYGAGSKSQIEQLEQMFDIIKPGWVGMGVHTESDYKVISGTIGTKIGIKRIKAQSNCCVYLGKDGNGKFGKANEGGMVLDLTQMKEMPAELEDMNFGLLVNQKVHSPELFQSILV